jgi:hypothetical protein
MSRGFEMMNFSEKKRTRRNSGFDPVAIKLGIVALVLAMAEIVLGASPRQKLFASADEAARALIEAAKAEDAKPLLQILGPEAKSFLESGDRVSDRESREWFVAAYGEAHALVKSGESKVFLEVGKDKWPFPIPIVHEKAGWRFDTKEGREEIVNRRIGRNELDVIQVCLAFVDAQLEYYRRNPQNEPLLQYAQKFLSTKGKRDGLYWEGKSGEEPSPFGSLVAEARAEGYREGGGKPVPYRGYYYKILTGQGKDAPGGAYDYRVRGKMAGGFGMIAYPAQYGSSGVMTFIINHDGIVYEQDLGSKTAQVAAAMTRFNPDKSWKQAAKAD